MKILKFFGWTLLSLFVLFFALMIILALFDYFNDDMEIKKNQKTSQKMDRELISLYSAYFDKNSGVYDFREIMDKSPESDIHLIQNLPESLYQKLEADNEDTNLYFSYVKRFPISYSHTRRLSLMDFSGLLSVSAFQPQSIKKMLLPIETNWINSLLVPSPSIQIMEFELRDSERLYLINLENELPKQFENFKLKHERINYLKESFIDRIAEDAYCVIAGNWQTIFPGQLVENGESSAPSIPIDWTKEGWQWIYNIEEKSGYGLLVSKHIEVEEVKFLEPFMKGLSSPIWVRLNLK